MLTSPQQYLQYFTPPFPRLENTGLCVRLSLTITYIDSNYIAIGIWTRAYSEWWVYTVYKLENCFIIKTYNKTFYSRVVQGPNKSCNLYIYNHTAVGKTTTHSDFGINDAAITITMNDFTTNILTANEEFFIRSVVILLET